MKTNPNAPVTTIVMGTDEVHIGLTKLELFSAIAMLGYMANPNEKFATEELAGDSIRVAESLIEALNEKYKTT